MESEEIEWTRPRGYQDLIESVTQYNTKLSVERVSSCPYVDGQTGIAMVNALNKYKVNSLRTKLRFLGVIFDFYYSEIQ